jgi:hypothetical protein
VYTGSVSPAWLSAAAACVAAAVAIAALVVTLFTRSENRRLTGAATASAEAARRSADHAANVDRRDAERRFGERASKVTLSAAMPSATRGWPDVVLHSMDSRALDEVILEIVREVGAEPAGVLRDAPSGDTGRSVTIRSVQPYESFPTQVELDPGPNRSERLRVVVSRVRCGDEIWEGLADEILIFPNPQLPRRIR